MAYTNVTWTTGEVIPKTKLDATQANSDHVREEGDYHILLNTWYMATEFATNARSYQVEIDGVQFSTDMTSSGENLRADVDISSLSEGIHVLKIVHGTLGSAFSPPFTFRFYKTPDMDYLTWWLDINNVTGSGAPYTHSFNYFHVIAHREIKGWT